MGIYLNGGRRYRQNRHILARKAGNTKANCPNSLNSSIIMTEEEVMSKYKKAKL
jgi:hypothetical protein